MHNITLLGLLLLSLLTACAPPAQPTGDPVPDSSPIPELDKNESLDDVLIHRLSVNLGLDADEITLKEHREVEFTDLCFDIAPQDTECAQALIPGRIFIFEANGFEYEFRTTLAGDSIQPATLALFWTREGGIAGFCDGLVVYLSGEVKAANCRSQPKETSGTFARLLSVQQQRQFFSWYSDYGEAVLDVSDPAGVSDRMINTLEFFGAGAGKPDRAAQEAMFEWALELFQKLNS
jgi:hypothetical protein